MKTACTLQPSLSNVRQQYAFNWYYCNRMYASFECMVICVHAVLSNISPSSLTLPQLRMRNRRERKRQVEINEWAMFWFACFGIGRNIEKMWKCKIVCIAHVLVFFFILCLVSIRVLFRINECLQKLLCLDIVVWILSKKLRYKILI